MSGLKDLKNTKTCHPENETWFTCWDNTRENIMSYGSILPTQCMETKWTEVDHYNKETDYVDVLLDNGINPFPEEEQEEQEEQE